MFVLVKIYRLRRGGSQCEDIICNSDSKNRIADLLRRIHPDIRKASMSTLYDLEYTCDDRKCDFFVIQDGEEKWEEIVYKIVKVPTIL